jgi:hypothetical protein
VSFGGPTTTVFCDARGNLYVPQRPLTAADRMVRPPKRVYTVDTGEHAERFDVELPSEDEMFFFNAGIALVWQVKDAVAAVESGLSEPQGAYRPQVEELLRNVARRYPIENGAAAERAMNDVFSTPRRVAQGVEVVRCTVQLTRDDRTVKREQGLLDQRMRFYKDVLTDGGGMDFALMALKLAGGNEDVDDVIKLILQRNHLDFEGARGALTAMMENGLINRSESDHLLARVNKIMSDHLTSPPFSIGTGGAAAPRSDHSLTIEGTAQDANGGIPEAFPSGRPQDKADNEQRTDDTEDEYDEDDLS